MKIETMKLDSGCGRGRHELAPRHDADDREVDAEVDHRDGGGADQDRPRDHAARVAHLVADVADVVVAEVVVDPDARRGAEPEEEAEREVERAGREVERDVRIEVQRARDDHGEHREQRADPERDRDRADRVDAPVEQRDVDDADRR